MAARIIDGLACSRFAGHRNSVGRLALGNDGDLADFRQDFQPCAAAGKKTLNGAICRRAHLGRTRDHIGIGDRNAGGDGRIRYDLLEEIRIGNVDRLAEVRRRRNFHCQRLIYRAARGHEGNRASPDK